MLPRYALSIPEDRPGTDGYVSWATRRITFPRPQGLPVANNAFLVFGKLISALHVLSELRTCLPGCTWYRPLSATVDTAILACGLLQYNNLLP